MTNFLKEGNGKLSFSRIGSFLGVVVILAMASYGLWYGVKGEEVAMPGADGKTAIVKQVQWKEIADWQGSLFTNGALFILALYGTNSAKASFAKWTEAKNGQPK